MEQPFLIHSRYGEAPGAEPPLGLSEPDLSISEVNHRVSNNLALLASTVSMRANGFSRREGAVSAHEVAAALHEVTARIVAVGHLHRLLSARPDASHAEFGPHMRELCRLFISALAERGQMELVETGTTDCVVNATDFLPLSLIVTEVVTNALKYAHPAGAPGKLIIGCHCDDDGTVVIQVADDGVGFPDGFDLTVDAGIGFRTIEVLAQQIGAVTSFENRATGLRFELRLPAL